jgi:hypothetical protein
MYSAVLYLVLLRTPTLVGGDDVGTGKQGFRELEGA